MDELKNMGWSSEANTFVSYSKRSGDNEICVSKPSVFGEKWVCTIREIDDEGHVDEVIVNSDADVQWVLDFYELIKIAK